MARLLSDSAVKNAKPQDKRYKLSDVQGLYLEVAPNGGKWWRLRYRYNGKEKLISLGVYPAVSLKMARERRNEARRMLAEGKDPYIENQKLALEAEKTVPTFQSVAIDWFNLKIKNWAASHAKTVKMRLRCLEKLPEKPINEMQLEDFLPLLKDYENSGKIETCHRLSQIISQVCRYGRLMKFMTHDPLQDIKELLATPKNKPRAALLESEKIGRLLADINEYNGFSFIRYALKIMPYVFIRSSELRLATWDEINFKKAIWTIPAERMKMRRLHIVPLASQVLELFANLRKLNKSNLCFPSPMSNTRPISDVGLLNALRRLGYSREEMCIHGFRAIASTHLNEMGFRPDIIEVQLAHVEQNAVRAAYNRADYFNERKVMMQSWADYLDKLRNDVLKK